MSEICEMFASTFLSHWLEWKAVKKNLTRKMYFLYEIELEEAIYQTCKENNPTFTRNSTKRPAETFSI